MQNCPIKYLFIFSIFFSCSVKSDLNETETNEESNGEISFNVERAPEWTALFKRSSGWFGGDGIFAIPYSGVDQGSSSEDSILFLFSDTMIGEIKEGELQEGYEMVNNSMAMLTGENADEENITFLIAKNKNNDPATVFTPQTPEAQPEDYYWLGDGFVNSAKDNNIYIFAYRIQNTQEKNAQFPFREVGNSIIVIPNDSSFPFEDHRQLDVPFFASSGGDSTYTSFGSGVLANTQEAGVANGDGYIYVYGVKGSRKKLLAARVKPEDFEIFENWKFWNGSEWSSNVDNLAAVSDSVSNELSVVPIADKKYALIYQYGGIYPTIYMQIGSSPVGPFGPRIEVYNTQDDITDPDLFTYNAKAHPAISRPGELLVSYNVNSFKFFDVIEDKPNLYRPRFIRIIFE